MKYIGIRFRVGLRDDIGFYKQPQEAQFLKA